ncbi:hypothetical protein T07_11228 [Trichinella nelsoni]|uniref:Uncharacterized protein n=1 Tax=Trichinella nelsoni TaxID=6336 RepID=A0A0V0RBQ5_9BILA|nr:hypothetical protein T07_11228 [Trichinella nelsoni]
MIHQTKHFPFFAEFFKTFQTFLWESCFKVCLLWKAFTLSAFNLLRHLL